MTVSTGGLDLFPTLSFAGVNCVLNFVSSNSISEVPTTINPEISVIQRFTAPKFLYVTTLHSTESCRLQETSTVAEHSSDEMRKMYLNCKCRATNQKDGGSILRIKNVNRLFITSLSVYRRKLRLYHTRTVSLSSLAVIVRVQVLTAESMKFRIVFWDVLPCKIIVDRR
jgi:hypothetical protein